MSKICAKCEKPVYPLEELKCLDKIWHKGCFKCWECGMSLNMKNYKGFDRKPYCSAHYPQTKATVVADTPELQRLSQTSKIQSQAKYHEEFEKKIKGSKIQVADDPETQRLKQLSSVVSQVEYKGLREKNMDMEARRQNVSQPEVPEKSFRRPDNYPSENQKPSPYSDRSVSHSTVYGADGRVMESQSTQRKIGSIADYDPTNYSSTLPHSSLRQTQEWEETVVFSPQNFPSQPCNNQASSGGELRYSSLERPAPAGTDGISSSMVGNRDVKPYDGAAVTGGQPVASSDLAEDQQYLAQQQQILQQQQDPQQQQVRWQQQQQQQQQYAQQQQMREQQQQQQQQMREQQQQQQLREQQLKEQQLREQQLREQQQQQMEQRQFKEQQMREQQLLQQQRQQQNDELSAQTAQNVQHSRKLAGTIFQAMYDYDAQDDDEVSFMENDLVVNCDPIDEGWMYGTIQRTGQRGMLPANYVERVQ